MIKILKKTLQKKEKIPKNYFFGDDIPLDWLNIKKRNMSDRRLVFIEAVLYIIFVIIILKLFSINIDFDFFKKNLIDNTSTNSSYRPDILDRNGKLLATNLPTFDLYVEPHNVVDAEQSSKKLAQILPDLKYDDLVKKLKSSKKFIYIARKISPLEKEKITLIGEPGLNFIKNEGRVYPHTNLFSHIIGSVDVDNNAISGIEKYIDNNELKNSEKPVILSIDMYIQDAIRQHLLKAMTDFNAKSAAGIVMDVATGEILGMVSLPDFSNNEYAKVVTNPLFNNHVTLDVYEFGSVMKIFNTALAIENNYPLNKIFDVSKPFMIGNHAIKDSHPKKWLINVVEGFIHSSNIVMANIAKDLGISKQKDFLKKLNLLEKIDFELPERGTTIYPKDWNEFYSASIGFGYSISPTMLAVVSAINGIVNDGLYVNPTILKRDKNETLKSYQVVDQKTSDAIKKFMRLVITNGTGYMANLKNIKVGGKTGTSYKIVDGKYDNTKIRTFFASIFPADRPKYTMLIMLDEAKNKNCNTAACTAVPISADIIKDVSTILNLDIKNNID